jgi:hypothetical protein
LRRCSANRSRPKHDINELRAELRELEQRLVIKLGGMVAVVPSLVRLL